MVTDLPAARMTPPWGQVVKLNVAYSGLISFRLLLSEVRVGRDRELI